MINWKEQWGGGEQFAPGWEGEHARVPLGAAGSILLEAGGGFGDMSHPTTHLMIDLLKKSVQPEHTVVDIGCGSGILSLAALKLGAKRAIAIDIEPDALAHTENNARLNNVNLEICDGIKETPHGPLLILMNMIWSEQKKAWRDLPGPLITSGILVSERESYVRSWDRPLTETVEKEGWLAFKFG